MKEEQENKTVSWLESKPKVSETFHLERLYWLLTKPDSYFLRWDSVDWTVSM